MVTSTSLLYVTNNDDNDDDNDKNNDNILKYVSWGKCINVVSDI